MKLAEIFEELQELARRLGISVRKESGNFQSGYCILNEKKMIIFNRGATLETKSAVLARCLINQPIDDIYVKPVIRDFIEKERAVVLNNQDLNIDIS